MSIHDGSVVLLVTVDRVIPKTPNDGEAVDHHRPVHIYRRDRQRRWEEGEDHGDKGIDEGDDIHGKAPSTKLPWSKRNGFFEEPFAHHQTN